MAHSSLSKKSVDFFDKVAIKFSKRKLNRYQSNTSSNFLYLLEKMFNKI